MTVYIYLGMSTFIVKLFFFTFKMQFTNPREAPALEHGAS